jgi:hypothetical protein
MRGGAAPPPAPESAPPSRHPPWKPVSATWVQGRPYTPRPDQRPRLRLRLRARGRCNLLSALNAHRQAHLVGIRQVPVRPGTLHSLERGALVGEPGEIGGGDGGRLGLVLGGVFFVDVGRAAACISVRDVKVEREMLECVCVALRDAIRGTVRDSRLRENKGKHREGKEEPVGLAEPVQTTLLLIGIFVRTT